MLSTDTFFSDVERVIAEFTDTEADRPRLQQMIRELNYIVKEVPRVAHRCYAYQARLYAKLQDYAHALNAIEQALELMPLDDRLLILRGDIHREAQNHTLALEDYNNVLAAHPDSVTARIHRAETNQAQGDFEAALRDINEALKHEPRSPRLIYRRGMVLMDLRRVSEALADFRAVVRQGGDAEYRAKAKQRLSELGER